ncbi:11500_t:CDS:2, partial [Scutellospora calospora]
TVHKITRKLEIQNNEHILNIINIFKTRLTNDNLIAIQAYIAHNITKNLYQKIWVIRCQSQHSSSSQPEPIE